MKNNEKIEEIIFTIVALVAIVSMIFIGC